MILILFSVAFVIACVGLVFCIYMFFRNESIAKMRHQFLDDIRKDFDNYSKLISIYDDDMPSYDEMMHKFWIPLDRYRKLWKTTLKKVKVKK